MNIVMNATIIAFLMSTVGVTIGSCLGILVGRMGNRFFSAILGATAGLMMAVVCFELLPNSFSKSSVELSVCGIILGVATIVILDSMVGKIKKNKVSSVGNKYYKMAILMAVGMGLHHFPEGIAVGTSYTASKALGISIALIIALHDIPEGFVVAAPLKLSKMSNPKIMFYVLLTQIPMGLGALIGSVVGEISSLMVSCSLAFAAGAMLYITCSEIIPQSNKMYRGRTPALADILGFIIGMIVSAKI